MLRKNNTSNNKARVSADFSLTEAEAAIMDVVWNSAEPITFPNVYSELTDLCAAKKQRPFTYSSVNTVLRRLVDRGFLSIAPGTPRNSRYYATVDRHRFAAQSMEQLARRLMPQLSGGATVQITSEIQNLLDELSHADQSEEIKRGDDDP